MPMLAAVLTRYQQPEGGGALPLLAGGEFWQGSMRTAYAPRQLGGAEISIEVQATEEYQTTLLHHLPTLLAAGPVSFWMSWPVTDGWLIPSAAKTTWTLSRTLPFAWGLPIADYEPRVTVIDRSDLRAAGVVATLTRSATSPPSAGEYYVDPAANGTTLETANLTAHAGLELLALYWPVRLIDRAPAEWSVRQHNDMEISLDLVEMVEARTYAGLD